MVVDQFSAWVAEERLAELPTSGGFARLRREGTWVRTMRLPYAVTDTAPGHASLHSGKVPAESGIWGNELPDPKTGGRITFLLDDSVKVVGPEGVLTDPGSSAARLKVDNIADRLRKKEPNAFIASFSVKDRGAIMPGGHAPSVALWFDARLGTFVTSTAFAASFPDWARPIADRAAVERARAVPWTLSDEPWVQKHARAKRDDAPGEGDLEGFGVTFPHVAKSNAAFRGSPASDRMIFALGLAALDAAIAKDPKREQPILLLLSMSASDVLGHVFGPDSWEAWDHLHKLDAALGVFLSEVERRSPFQIVLSADHGNSSMPEVVRANRPASCATDKPRDRYDRPICDAGTRIEPHDLERDLRAEIKRALGTSEELLLGVADPYLFLTERGRTLEAPRRRLLDDTIRRVFQRRGEVADLFDVRDLEVRCPNKLKDARPIPSRALPGEDVLTLVCRSWPPGTGAGDFYMVPKLGTVFDGEIVPNHGASHGGPWLYDRTVPMLVRGEGVASSVVIDEPVDFTAYAGVLSAWLALGTTQAPSEILESLRGR